jgi:Type IV pili methyl-accepting chemotaxis transducer N-term
MLNSLKPSATTDNSPWMPSRRKFVASSALAMGILWMGQHFEVIAQINTLPEAINKAGSLRMLSQRITKAWLQILSKINPDASQKILDDSISLFDKRLSELQWYTSKNLAVATQYDILEKEWNEFKKMIRGKNPSAEMVSSLIPKSDQVRNFANTAVTELEKGSSAPANRLVNIAGWQRMLSQLITRELYLARLPGQSMAVSKTLVDAIKLFKSSHQELLAHPGNTPAIKSQLELAEMMWIFLENASSNKWPETAPQVASASENLLKTLEALVPLYEKV